MSPSSEVVVGTRLPQPVALHARPAGRLVRAAAAFPCSIVVAANGINGLAVADDVTMVLVPDLITAAGAWYASMAGVVNSTFGKSVMPNPALKR